MSTTLFKLVRGMVSTCAMPARSFYVFKTTGRLFIARAELLPPQVFESKSC